MRMTVLARCADVRASSDARSSSETSASSGMLTVAGAAGGVFRSATAPAQKEHSFGSAARAERTKTCKRTREIAAFFMASTARNKGTMFLNPSSGARLAAAELAAAAAEAGIEVVHLTRDVDVAAAIRERMRDGKRLVISAGGVGTGECVDQPPAP